LEVDLIGHEDIVRELRSLAASEEPPHALLLAGPEGTGRAGLAQMYARLLNCTGRGPGPQDAFPCGVCRNCHLIEEGTHPDVITVAPGDVLCRPREGESHAKHPDSRDIRICQVRGIIDLVARYPFEANYRMIVLDPAERLGREAAHTLLKTLEEPPGHTVLVLITAAPESIIETILSRCRRIDVRTVPRPVIEAALVARGIEPAVANRAAEASRGLPAKALEYAKSPDLMGDRSRILGRCAQLAAANTGERFKYANDLAERFRSDRNKAGAELDIWESFWEERLRESAANGNRSQTSACLVAMKAIVQAREDLQTQVVARAALELMMLSFPRVRLDELSEEVSAAHA
jgi:DNA polymerase-3 subunit delta'